MKKVLVMLVVGLVLSAGLIACGSAQGGHCDAYGSLEKAPSAESSDLASK